MSWRENVSRDAEFCARPGTFPEHSWTVGTPDSQDMVGGRQPLGKFHALKTIFMVCTGPWLSTIQPVGSAPNPRPLPILVQLCHP